MKGAAFALRGLAHRKWFAPLLLTLAVLAVYGQTLAFDFVWDDLHLLRHLQAQADRGGAAGLLTADYGYLYQEVGYWRPVTALAMWLNGAVSSSARAFHAGSLLLYLAGVLLFHLLARALLPEGRGALFAALLFALLPPHSESVAFVGNRHDLLAFLFLMASALPWARDREGRRLSSLAAGGLALFLAVLSKESALVFPAVPLLFGLLDREREPGGARGWAGDWWRRNRRWLLAFAGGAVLALLLRLLFFSGGFGVGGGAIEKSLASPLFALSRAAFYLSMLVVPWPVKVTYNWAEASITLATAAGALVFFAIAIAAAGRRSGRWGLRMAAWSGVLLLPVSGLVPIGGEVVAARHLFAASAGPCLLAGYLLGRGMGGGEGRGSGEGRGNGEGRGSGEVPPRWRPAAVVAAGALVVALAAGSFAQARVWRNDLALFTRMANDVPGSELSFLNLGSVHLKAGRVDEAVAASRRAVELAPRAHQGWINLGRALERAGEHAGAEASLRRAVELAPAEAAPHYWLGRFLQRRGRVEEAAAALRGAVQADPADPDAWKGLGEALGKGKSFPEAAAALRRALALAPGDGDAARLLVLALLGAGETGAAREEYLRLTRMDPAAAAAVAPFVP